MFGYKCSECGKGTVREKSILKYQTKIKGYPYVVDEAKLGVCDECGAEYFPAKETKRWEQLFEHDVINNKLFLTSEDIIHLRQQLGLSMEQFALLIGCTRQSLYNWEKPSRSHPQSRTVDLIMKLVNKSQIDGKVDVIRLLVEEARKLGMKIKLPEVKKANFTALTKSIILQVEQIFKQGLIVHQPAGVLQYVAQNNIEPAITIVKMTDGRQIGKLNHEYLTGELVLQLESKDWDLSTYGLELITTKDETVKGKPEQMGEGKIILLKNSNYTEKEIKEIHLIPDVT